MKYSFVLLTGTKYLYLNSYLFYNDLEFIRNIKQKIVNKKQSL